MDNFFLLMAVATLIEGIISYGATIYKNGSIQWQIIIAFIIGAIFCYDMNLNFFTMLGLAEQFPVIGYVATAIILSRGSNYMFEFYNQLNTWRNKLQEIDNKENE